ncbi:OLC1v1036462C1 [Oldenlandia corymbosa var. corymbosa]|uniref:phosphoribosylformylglycinamidine cyclo-ligase n=1 Tax=Oldenlandia corymbosa var. corymbosa TaxID=529605 RepID=A0AAV1CYK9_OLDCO|nr:OLC1v1036462C1 [Oldenlandia corymbosa var. corymbosa]
MWSNFETIEVHYNCGCFPWPKFYIKNSNASMMKSVRDEANRDDTDRDEVNRNDVTDGLTYKDAGVDIDVGAELVRRVKKIAPGIGGFGGLILNPGGDSYLVVTTDGVGTKLKLAVETGIHDTVAMCVNDIVTSGAKHSLFLDYFATSHLDGDLAEKVIKGIVDGCQQSDCVLLGGETAEMPGFYACREYDVCGFAVDTVEKDSVIDGKNIVVRISSLVFLRVETDFLLLEASNSMSKVLDLVRKGVVKGIAHITGGGFMENIPRIFPEGLGAVIHKDSWVVPPVFNWIQETNNTILPLHFAAETSQAGRIDDAEMRRTFNMGIRMVLVVYKEAADRILGDG